MSEHRHIILDGLAQKVDYETTGHGKSFIIERENALVHSGMLKSQYNEAIDGFENISAGLPPEVKPVKGSYLNVKVEKTANTLDKFDSKTGSRLMNVHSTPQDNEEQLTLFLPTNNNSWLSKKLGKYEEEPEGDAKRSNAYLVNSISNIAYAELNSFFLNEDEYASVTENPSEYEIWIDKELHVEGIVREAFLSINVTLCNRNVVFNDIVVYMIVATKSQLNMAIHAVPGISEIRLHRRPTILTKASTICEQDEWIKLIKDDRNVKDNLSRVAILDSGVTNSHPLIEDFLPADRCHSVTMTGNKRDLKNHGTGLASLVLYGDLTEAIYNQEHVNVYSDLTSVKMYPGDGEEPNNIEMYAAITEDAIVTGREDGAELLCSAVTTIYSSKDGIPSSTSAAIDQTLYNNGECDALMLISAGNVQDTGGLSYPDYLHVNPISDPAQSWNAITVGAFTNMVGISDPNYHNAQVIAPAGGVSPFSRSSTQWGKQSLIKPEILMEGGNGVLNNTSIDTVEDLSLVCADSHPLIKQFSTINATSAATAMAARLVSKIKNENPQLSPLSIRALLIHSAEWTDKMKELFTEDGKLNKLSILHTCGYGVPDEKKAIASSDTYVTFVAEDVIEPFVAGSGKSLKFGHMNLYELPWPKETLLQMGETEVTLKITLSYYICPSPGTRSMLSKYTYQSLRLNFDINGYTEDLRTFKNRIKRIREEGEERESGLSNRWTIGIQTRNQGSIISDRIEKTTAAQLASCNMIAIYPSGGWFKNYQDKENLKVKYSLVVSLETPEQVIYEEIANKIGLTIPITL